MSAALLACDGLSVDIGGRRLVASLELDLRPGECLGVLGCNGAGKTTLLHTLAGLRAPASGEIRLGGEVLDALGRRDVARRLAVLMQTVEDPFPASVLETALIGRHPHLDFLQWESSRDLQIARDALASVDLAGVESREVDTLSGGERRRLAIAAVLAQTPDVFLLDEPSNHLDPHHRRDVMTLFRARADAGAAVLVTLHDPNLAGRYCDRCLLLHGDGRWQLGPRDDVLNDENLTTLYRLPIHTLHRDGHRVFVEG